jgi:hypothetical protein
VYEKQRHFHGLAYRRLTNQLTQLSLKPRTQNSEDDPDVENLEDLFFIPQDFTTSVPSSVDLSEEKAASDGEGFSTELLAEYFDLLPDL